MDTIEGERVSFDTSLLNATYLIACENVLFMGSGSNRALFRMAQGKGVAYVKNSVLNYGFQCTGFAILHFFNCTMLFGSITIPNAELATSSQPSQINFYNNTINSNLNTVSNTTTQPINLYLYGCSIESLVFQLTGSGVTCRSNIIPRGLTISSAANFIPLGITSVASLIDVASYNSIATNHVLTYNTGTSKWVNKLLALSGLSDINIGTLVNNQALLYDTATGKWLNKIPALSGLSDINIGTLVNNQTLLYDTATAKWLNKTQVLSALGDTNITAPANNQALLYDSTGKWINKTPALNGLSDTNITAPVDSQILLYFGGKWVNTTAIASYMSQSVTWANVSNVSNVTSQILFYQRVGNLLSGTFNATLTLANPAIGSSFTLTIPDANNFGSSFWANGTAGFLVNGGNSATAGIINAVAGTTNIQIYIGQASTINSGAVTGTIGCNFQCRLV